LNTARTWRGGENQTLLLCRGLVDRGYESYICCPPSSPLHSAAAGEDLRVFNLPLRGEWDLKSAWSLAELIKKQGIGILHMQTAHSHALGVLAKFLVPGVKTVLSRRVDFHIRKNPLSRLKYRLNTDVIICVSRGIKNVLLSDGLDARRLEVVHDGIDLGRFESVVVPPDLPASLGIKPGDPVIGNVGALAPHKDLFNLLEASSILARRYPNLKVLVAGEGELERKLKKRRDSLGLQQVVRFLGFRQDVPSLLRLFRVFVLSSYLEGLSSSILDAMASGVPVVATRTGGVPEVVIDRRTGLLVPPRNPRALAEAIGRLLDNPGLARELAANARERVKDFSADAMVEKTISVYRKLWIPKKV